MSTTITLTIDNTKVSADVSDFPVAVVLADMPADFWSTVANGGGDIRVYKADGVTELAREVVSCDTATDTGVLHFLADFISSSSDTVFNIVVDGVGADYAVTDTYGRNAVWSDYTIVHHLNIYEANPTNSVGSNNGTAFSLSSSDEIAGAVGGGLNMPNTGDYVSTANAAMTSFTLQAIVKKDGNPSAGNAIIERAISIGSFTRMQMLRVIHTGSVNFQARNGSAAQNFQLVSSGTVTNNAWRWVHGTCTSGAQRIYIDGINDGSGSVTHGANSLTTNFFVNRTYDSSARYLNAGFDEVRVRASALSADWVATEYNNQSSPSTFYTATVSGGSGGPEYTLTANTGTFSLSGVDAGVFFNRTLTPEATSFTLTGQATTLRRTFNLSATPASFEFTGIQTGLFRQFVLTASQGTFDVTGYDIAFGRQYALTVQTGTFTLTGYQVGISTEAQLVASTGSFAFSGFEASLTVSRLLEAPVTSYDLSGTDAGLAVARTISLEPSSFVLTTEEADLRRQFLLTALASSYELTGQDASLLRSAILRADTDTIALTGYDVNLVTFSGTRRTFRPRSSQFTPRGPLFTDRV